MFKKKSGVEHKMFRFFSAAGIFSFIMCVLMSFSCAGASEKGPLFIQVHFTSPLVNITPGQARAILCGRVSNFRDIGGRQGPVHLYVDRGAAGQVRAACPHLEFSTASFSEQSGLAHDPFFMGISDVSGLRPCFRILYIDGNLPWGRAGKDYTLDPGAGCYALMFPGVRPFRRDCAVTVVQTGVTAMTRAFIAAVDRAGDTGYPVRHTRAITARADIAVTSNEVSFLDPCTYPLRDNLTFCSPLRYFSILTGSGFDVIELTGNHNNDYGKKYNLATMDMIEKAGMIYFGGGRNRRDAARVKYMKVRGMVFAFVGFNELGPPDAWAGEKTPGALRFRRELFDRLVKEAVKNADIVFVSVQWGNENSPRPWPKQVEYFHRAADLGAAIMVSSSAHRAMGLEFYRGRFISYGLGNFLFDQMQSINHRRGIMARHIFYRGRHISTELIPYLMHGYCSPVPVHGAEARGIFNYIFRYSRGPVFGK